MMESKEIVNILGGTQNIEQPPKASGRSASLKLKIAKKKMARNMVDAKFTRQLVFKTRAVNRLSERLEYPKDDLLSIINVKGRTAQRREKEGTLSEDESDRLYRIARVTEKAERVFGSTQKAHEWLKSENSVFRGVSPLSLLGSDAGAEAVTDELGRIEFGDLF